MNNKKENKTDYFWDKCMPAQRDDITETICKKTFQKIYQTTNEQPLLPAAKEKKRKRIYWITTAAAASIALFVLSVFFMKNASLSHPDFKEAVVMMEQFPVEAEDHILLLLSESEKLQLTTDALITYNAEGEVAVDAAERIVSGKEASAYPESYNLLIVPKGKYSRLLFSDGTKAWVNAGTKVIFPRVFTEDKREIFVDGEVYLEVTPDAKRPFYVNTDGFDIKVLGTSFNVFAYKQMATSNVALVSGSVEIKDHFNQQLQMSPNELVTLEGQHITEKKSVRAEDYKAWIERIMILNGESLKQLTERLSLLYGVQISCDASLENEQVYGKFDLRENYKNIIEYIQLMIPLSVEYGKDEIILQKE